MTRLGTVAATAALAVVAGCGGTPAGSESDENRFDLARRLCEPETDPDLPASAMDDLRAYRAFVTVTDDGAGMSLHTEGEDQAGADYEGVMCVLHVLEVPGAVTARMGNTRSLDGTQEASWDGISAWWTYHPDAGFNVVLEDDQTAG